MPQTGDDKALLAQILGKVNALPAGSVGSFSPDELNVLRGVLTARHAEPLGEKERGFLAHVQAIVQAHSTPGTDDAEAHRRKNVLLRSAIDKCLLGRTSDVTDIERALITNTAHQLGAIRDPSESHLRLQVLVLDSLAALGDELAPAGGGVVPTGNAVDAESFFSGGTRTRLREFLDIPLDINARVVEHEGNIEINGNVPDDVALVVKEGGVVIHGQCDGSILASGPIEVRGNVAGPWTISTTGAIQCERILGGANLYAPLEKIVCNAMERPGLIFSGVGIEVAADVRGGTLISPVIEIAGAMRGAHAQVLKSLTCNHVEGDAREPAQVVFRNLMTAEDYRMEVSDQAWHLAREAVRFRFRLAVGKAVVECLQDDLEAVQRVRLAAMGKVAGIDIKSLRSLQAKAAYLAVAIIIGENLEQVLLEATELEGDTQATALISGTDEAQAAIKFLEREVAHLSDDSTREPKALVISAAKHLHNLAKKIRDCGGNRPALEEDAHALLLRLTEWRDLRDGARDALGQTTELLRNAVGAGVYGESDPAQLARTVAAAAQAAGAAANTPPLRSLKALAERYEIGLSTYRQGTAEVAAELERLEANLAQEQSILLGEGRRGDRFLKAARIGPHVVVAASPGLDMPHVGSGDLEAGRNVRIDRELPGPAVYRCDGLQVRRTML